MVFNNLSWGISCDIKLDIGFVELKVKEIIKNNIISISFLEWNIILLNLINNKMKIIKIVVIWKNGVKIVIIKNFFVWLFSKYFSFIFKKIIDVINFNGLFININNKFIGNKIEIEEI